MSSYRTLTAIAPAIEKVLAQVAMRRRFCFDNALAIAKAIPDVGYVVGRTAHVDGDHAWNEYHGVHFDLTAEIAFRGAVDFGRYYAVVRLDYASAKKVTPLRPAPNLPDIWIASLEQGETPAS